MDQNGFVFKTQNKFQGGKLPKVFGDMTELVLFVPWCCVWY